MRARARFSRSSRRWRWSLVCRANWRLSNVAAPYHARLRRHVRVRARRVHRSEEHTSELQSLAYLVCRLLLEKKKKIAYATCMCSEVEDVGYAAMHRLHS